MRYISGLTNIKFPKKAPLKILSAAILGLSFLPSTAAAQSHDFVQSQFQQGSEARLSFKVPFGTHRKDYKAQPRVAFSVRRYKENDGPNNDWMFRSGLRNNYTENEFAVSLSQTPQMSINGQAIHYPNSETAELSDGVKTAGKVALGAGIAVVVVGAIGAIIILTNDNDDVCG